MWSATPRSQKGISLPAWLRTGLVLSEKDRKISIPTTWTKRCTYQVDEDLGMAKWSDA